MAGALTTEEEGQGQAGFPACHLAEAASAPPCSPELREIIIFSSSFLKSRQSARVPHLWALIKALPFLLYKMTNHPP